MGLLPWAPRDRRSSALDILPSLGPLQGIVSPSEQQPTSVETLYQFPTVTLTGLTGKLSALPESEIRPLAIGSSR